MPLIKRAYRWCQPRPGRQCRKKHRASRPGAARPEEYYRGARGKLRLSGMSGLVKSFRAGTQVAKHGNLRRLRRGGGQLSGFVQVDFNGREVLSTQDTDESSLSALETSSGEISVDNNPWFEWVNEDGDPVGEVFDRLHVDPVAAVSDLKNQLSTNNGFKLTK